MIVSVACPKAIGGSTAYNAIVAAKAKNKKPEIGRLISNFLLSAADWPGARYSPA
jgi:hypothetical protein